MIKKFLKKIIPWKIVNFVKRCLVYFPFEKSNDYNGKILQEFSFKNSLKDNICIFSHYDKDDIIDDYVVNYIKNISEQNFDIVFVSTAEHLHIDEIEKIKDYCRDIIVKENIGYDFGAWATGIIYIDKEVNSYKSLLLCNDSVYAPLFPLNEMFDKMKNRYDFWGITDSHEIYHHLQSYFMVFENSVVTSKLFKDIWKNYKVYSIKRNIILQYEIGISQKLIKNGYLMGAYCPFNSLDSLKICNATHYQWRELIEKLRCPIVKVELLRDNPKNINIFKWQYFIKQQCNYDVGLIEKHLSRVSD